MKILIASNNKHKFHEINKIAKLFNVYNLEFVMPSDLDNNKINPTENGLNYYENAFIKAKEFYDHFKIPCIADDSGLEVTVLGNAPGLYSSRFAGENATDSENRTKVCSELKKLGVGSSSAKFICVICYYEGKIPYYFEGEVQGKVIIEEKGNRGFGYDPIFIPQNYELTFAELEEKIKDRISHRSKALQKFINIINKKAV